MIIHIFQKTNPSEIRKFDIWPLNYKLFTARPQSLEAYYEEVGRAGRDGKLADCILYANLSRLPSLLTSKRSEEQKQHAYKMLTDCFRYGMNTSICRAKVLVEYFREVSHVESCMFCDICKNGSPELQNLKAEANIFLQVIAAHYEHVEFMSEKPNLRMIVTKIRELSQQFLAIVICYGGGA